MTPQELKNSILQLAIQGRLVEQRPEEGTAEELYRQIQQEKAALIKAGKIKKEKPLPEITEEEVPFEIPEGWKWVRLNSIALKITDGTHHSPPNSEHGEYMYVTAKNIKDSGVQLANITYVAKDIHDEIYSRCNPELNDILLIKDGATTGIVTVNNIDKPVSMLSSVALIKVPKEFCPWYIVYVMRSQLFYRGIREQMKGTGITRITLRQIEPLVIPLPPLAEQKRIVVKIEELLPYIDRYEKAWSRLEDFNKRFPTDMQKSILQLAIQGKLVPQRLEEGTGEALYQQIQTEKQSLIRSGKLKKEKPLPEITSDVIPFDIPESWMWARFLSVVDIATNLVQPADYLDYMHIAPDNIEKGNGHLLECRTVEQDKVASANHLFHKGQVLYSKIRPLLRKAVIAPFDGLCSADMYPLDTRLDVQYLLHYMLSDAFNLQIATAMSSRVKMPKINQDELSKALIPIPPLAEQKRIVVKLEELLPLCDRLK